MSSDRSLRCKLQAAAWSTLGHITRAPAATIEVRAEEGGTELRLVVTPRGAAIPAGRGLAFARLFFGPLEQQIVSTIAGGHLMGKTLAKKLRHEDGNGQANLQLRMALKLLCERGVLSDDDGYSLTDDGAALGRALGLLSDATPAA